MDLEPQEEVEEEGGEESIGGDEEANKQKEPQGLWSLHIVIIVYI